MRIRPAAHMTPSNSGHAGPKMDTGREIRGRFESAFKRYSAQTARLREMRAALPVDPGSEHIHEIHEEWRVIYEAERDYRSVRLEYVRHLLTMKDKKGLRCG